MTDQHERWEREHTALSWRLIEWKVAYYRPDLVHRSRRKDYEISDDEYDAFEQRYLLLCRRLDKQNTLVHKAYPGFKSVGYRHAMIEVDLKRPSVQLVISKLRTPKTQRVLIESKRRVRI